MSVSGSSVIQVASGATVTVSYTSGCRRYQWRRDQDGAGQHPSHGCAHGRSGWAIAGRVDGLDNVSFSYQWVYTPVADDVGKAIKVKVSFRDDRNHQESLTSEATAAVATAADESSIWSATLTVGSIGGYRGFWEDWTGSLAPDGFNIDGSDYTVISLINYSDLMFVFVLDRALPGDFTLQVGDTTFRSEEAEVNTSPSSYSYQWQNKMPDLSDGDTVQIGLTLAE